MPYTACYTRLRAISTRAVQGHASWLALADELEQLTHDAEAIDQAPAHAYETVHACIDSARRASAQHDGLDSICRGCAALFEAMRASELLRRVSVGSSPP